MQIGQRVRGAAGNKQIHRQQLVQAFGDLGAAAKCAAGQGAAAHGDHHLGGRGRFVGLQQGGFHKKPRVKA